MTAREPPQLDADGHLDGRRGEVLLLLAGLQLHQHLVELSGESVSLRIWPQGWAQATHVPPVTGMTNHLLCAQHLKFFSWGLCACCPLSSLWELEARHGQGFCFGPRLRAQAGVGGSGREEGQGAPRHLLSALPPGQASSSEGT